jgi:hypothetical protein
MIKQIEDHDSLSGFVWGEIIVTNRIALYDKAGISLVGRTIEPIKRVLMSP